MIPTLQVMYAIGWLGALAIMATDDPRPAGEDVRMAGILVLWPLMVFASTLELWLPSKRRP